MYKVLLNSHAVCTSAYNEVTQTDKNKILPSSGLFRGVRLFETGVVRLSVPPLKMEPIGRPETSVSNHLMPRNNPEEEVLQFNRGCSMRSCIVTKTDFV